MTIRFAGKSKCTRPGDDGGVGVERGRGGRSKRPTDPFHSGSGPLRVTTVPDRASGDLRHNAGLPGFSRGASNPMDWSKALGPPRLSSTEIAATVLLFATLRHERRPEAADP